MKTFEELMQLDVDQLNQKTNELADSILTLDENSKINLMRDLAKKHPTLESFIPTPSTEALNITDNETVLANAEKHTEHHTLYKSMLALSNEQKEQLKEKLGTTLTKFAVINLLFLYIEGSKPSTAQGGRVLFAAARQTLNAFFSATDRNYKTEFFIAVLAELYKTNPFQHCRDFVKDRRETSQYPKAKALSDAAYLDVIRRGVNSENALTLFDANTLSIVTSVTATTNLINNKSQTHYPYSFQRVGI